MFKHLPSLNSLRVFESAARLKSFKAAAQELYVTPTAVSHQIRTLEEKLGGLLFERKTRAVELTDEGAKLAQATYRSLQQISSTWEEIAASQSRLKISTTASFAAMWLVPKLDRFNAQHPGIEVVIRTGEVLEDLEKERRIDLAIRYGLADKAPPNTIKLVTEKFGMYANPGYLKGLKRIENATLIETQWKNTALPAISWRQYLRGKQKGALKNIRRFDQEHHAIQAALAGQGIALVSSLLVQTALEQGWLIEYDNQRSIPGLSYYLVVPPEKEHNRKVAVFREWLLQELAYLGDS